MIEPALAFGTGAHGSTRAALALLLRDPAPRGALLDIGCGSGVLAIAAARLGHGPVTAFDHDPHAVAATRENAAVNGVAVEAFGPTPWPTTCPPRRSSSRTCSSSCSSRCSRAASRAARDRVRAAGARAVRAGRLPAPPTGEVADGWQALLLERE